MALKLTRILNKEIIDQEITETLSHNALEVAKFRYMDEGETPDGMFERVAVAVANGAFKWKWSGTKAEDIEKQVFEMAGDFYRIMKELKFLPNTPCLANAGRALGQLSACFVLPIEDNITGIFNSLRDTALVHKTGGGTGFSFSSLRPSGFPVTLSRGTASGPISFMRVYDAATAEMKQGGIRRGANMGMLSVLHPDIMEFITCKDEEGALSNFNISVSIPNSFMTAAVNKDPYTTRWMNTKGSELSADGVLTEIATHAWKNGEPGVVFIDTVNSYNPLKDIETIESTNPCGEQPLPPKGSCTLGSIDLSKFVSDTSELMTDELRNTVELGVQFLDCIIEVNNYTLKSIGKEAKRTRRIGLGIMGFADMLIKMGVRYGSEKSVTIAEDVMSFISTAARTESERLGKLHGIPFALQQAGIERRNGCVTTIAPTGSLSIIANCSSGCEPVFSFRFDKKCIESNLEMVHPLLRDWMEENPGDDPPGYFVTAGQITMSEQLKVQAAFQKYVDSGISKTVNCINDTSVQEIKDAIVEAWKLGCKSVTFYRDGSRTFQAQTAADREEPEEYVDDLQETYLMDTATSSDHKFLPSSVHRTLVEKDRPSQLHGNTFCVKTGRGKLYLTINDLDGSPFEVFMNIGKSGAEDAAYSEALGRLISMALRMGVPVKYLVDHLKDISGDGVAFDMKTQIKSVPDAVAVVLEKNYLGTDEVEPEDQDSLDSVFASIDSDTSEYWSSPSKERCPDCGRTSVIAAEGCLTCDSCGWSKC